MSVSVWLCIAFACLVLFVFFIVFAVSVFGFDFFNELTVNSVVLRAFLLHDIVAMFMLFCCLEPDCVFVWLFCVLLFGFNLLLVSVLLLITDVLLAFVVGLFYCLLWIFAAVWVFGFVFVGWVFCIDL